MSTSFQSHKVAIVGAGPGGLAAARFLKLHGFEPVIYEKGSGVGGQWRGGDSPSGMWTAMSANTSRPLTCFSDLPLPAGTPMFPRAEQIHGYLRDYAEEFDLNRHARLGEGIERLERSGDGRGWTLYSRSAEGLGRAEAFERVIVATGRFNSPKLPSIPGLGTFSGSGGITHSFRFKGAEVYRGKRVLVAGSGVSSLEIACLLAHAGATVIVSQRRQRYIVPKIMAGVPADYRLFTRFAGLAGEVLTHEAVAACLKQRVVSHSGSPEQFGAPAPVENIHEAGVTRCQDFLPLVAEGRIEIRPSIHSVAGTHVRFWDDSETEVDALIFGTGYQLSLPYLSEKIRRTLAMDAHGMELHAHTFHPELPGLAFLGFYQQTGPYFPTLELQARWITYAWSGVRPYPRRAAMEQGLTVCRANRSFRGDIPLHVLALQFARLAGVEPHLNHWPDLKRALLFGPLSPISFRLCGPDALPDAARLTAKAAAEFGAITSPQFTPQECAAVCGLEEAGAPTFQA